MAGMMNTGRVGLDMDPTIKLFRDRAELET
jgi:hypothetical protein